MSVLRTYNQDKVEGVEMSEHCKWCNFPCEEDEIFCSECVKENPKLAKLNEFFLEQEKRINELENFVDEHEKEIVKMYKVTIESADEYTEYFKRFATKEEAKAFADEKVQKLMSSKPQAYAILISEAK